MSRRPRQRGRHQVAGAIGYVVLDSGGLTALLGRAQKARAVLRWIVEHGGRTLVPTPVLVETITGDAGRDAEVNRILGVLQRDRPVLVAPDEPTARRAGQLRFGARGDDCIDALVAAAAAAAAVDGPCVVLTSDPDDLGKLLAREARVAVRAV